MKTILNVCRKIKDISDDDFVEAAAVAEQQLSYFSPLKMKTSGRQHALGEHNALVLEKLRDLRDTIRRGESLNK